MNIIRKVRATNKIINQVDNICYEKTRFKSRYFFSIFTVLFGETITTKYPSPTQEALKKYIQDRNVPQKEAFDSTSSTTPSTINKGIKIAIFGACGYVGSYLTLYLSSAGFEVSPFDMNPRVPQPVCTKLHSNSVEREYLQSFNTVIFLGGCTGRRSCAELDPRDIEKNNIHDVINLVENMNPNQHFIVASTSAVTEGRYNATEKDSIYDDKLDEYSSSMYQREIALSHLALNNSESPRISMLRFGTVVGVSPGQRTDLLVPSLYKSAYKTGVLNVQSFNAMRSFLWLDDLSRAVQTIIDKMSWDDVKFNIWHLASFSATILKVATTVSSITGASIDTGDGISGDTLAEELSSFKGFSLNCDRFKSFFEFSFKGDLQTVLTEFDKNIPDSITAKGAHLVTDSSLVHSSIPCPVCNSNNQQLVLDLGSQPFANDFLRDESKSLNLSRFPLKLVRCRVCNHLHLSHIASREELFTHYLYQSGTSKTLAVYFEWLANLVIEESGKKMKGSVLEIACNDGSQLDQFKKRGWRTFGVDPAANIAPIAQQKGHDVKIGFWNEQIELKGFPKGDALTAIVAQNVFAHVPTPVGFLKACKNMMGPSTTLYIQTSQCNMHQLGQFDTAYHEHISFFTGHSFVKASELAGLKITSFETTPIHGTSCLVTMKLPAHGFNRTLEDTVSKTMHDRLNSEKVDGIPTDFFYEKYAARALVTRTWLINQVKTLKNNGYNVGAYGAAAKGMTLLHFILDDDDLKQMISLGRNWIDFVLDDAPLKQNTYCPGTSIPVYSTDFLGMHKVKGKLAIIIFAWNFWEEIAKKIKSQLIGTFSEVLILLPFPTPKLLRLNLDNENIDLMREVKYTPTQIPNIYHDISRNKVGLVTHQRNEEMLMPFFILHHAPMFDHATLIDFKSTDLTRAMIERYAPPSWKIVESKTGEVFDAEKTDKQVMQWENEYPRDWAIALTTTEFLIYDNFRQSLFERQPHDLYPYIHRFNYLLMVGNDTKPLRHFSSLIKQRHLFQINPHSYRNFWRNYGRFLHLNSVHYKYLLGRHRYASELKPNTTGTEMDGFIVKWMWTPWPEGLLRKTQVGATIPKSDSKRGVGLQHNKWVRNDTKLEKHLIDHQKKVLLKPYASLHDLCDDSADPNPRNSFTTFPGPVARKFDVVHANKFWNITLDFVAMKRIFHAVTGIVCD